MRHKLLVAFVAGFCAGTLTLYAVLWYQVYNKFEDTWCQVYTGRMTAEKIQRCDKIERGR